MKTILAKTGRRINALLPTTSIPKEKSKERHSKMKLRTLDSDEENNDEKTPKYNFHRRI